MTAPPGSEITIDADVVGKTPMSEPLDVEAGNHTVRVKLPDNTASEQKIVVTAGQVQPVRFGAAATVVNNPPNNPPTNIDNHPPANPPPNNPPENPPPNNPPPNNPPPVQHGEKVHPMGGLVLMIAGGALAVGGFVVGGIFGAIKSSANDNYISVQNQIISAQKADGIKSPTCNPPPSSKYTSACATLKSNQDAVNGDATVANTFVVIGIVGLAAAAGGVVWYFLGAKNKDTAARITPWMAPGTGGFSLSGSF